MGSNAQIGTWILPLAWALVACGPAAPSSPSDGLALASIDLRGVALLPAIAVTPAPSMPGQAFARLDAQGRTETLSVSVGTSSRGYLAGGVPLAKDHPHLKVRPVSVKRRAIHGTQALVRALEQAADAVAREWKGSQLFAGDLSARKGGDIPHHGSHNSGRDADLAFFVRDESGVMADKPAMDVMGAEASTGGGLLFDSARNWELVATLLKNPSIQVQWLFVAQHLRERMLHYARRAGAPARLIRRASVILHQPGDSSPHADHFHMRIYCGLEERLRGCVDTGTRHPWIKGYEVEIEQEISRVVALLEGGGDEEKRYVIRRIGQLAHASGARHLEPLVKESDKTLAIMAADTIAFLRGERTPPAWAHLTDEDLSE